MGQLNLTGERNRGFNQATVRILEPNTVLTYTTTSNSLEILDAYDISRTDSIVIIPKNTGANSVEVKIDVSYDKPIYVDGSFKETETTGSFEWEEYKEPIVSSPGDKLESISEQIIPLETGIRAVRISVKPQDSGQHSSGKVYLTGYNVQK